MEHAPGFSGGCLGEWVLEPWASSDFLGKFWKILEPVAKSWESSAENSGIFASSDDIVRGCTNNDSRRTGISVTCLSRVRGLTLAAAAWAKKGQRGARDSRRSPGPGEPQEGHSKCQRMPAKGGHQTKGTRRPRAARGRREDLEGQRGANSARVERHLDVLELCFAPRDQNPTYIGSER